MRSDCCTGVSETAGRRVSNVFASLPWHSISGPYHKVVALFFCRLVLLPRSRGLAPASKEDNVWAGYVHRMVKSVFRWRATHTESGPDKCLSVQHSNIIEIAFLKGAAHTTDVALHVFLTKSETSMDNQVRANQDWAVTFTGTGRRSYRVSKLNNLPVQLGLDQAIISRSRMNISLKKSVPFQPPNTNILVPPTKFAEWSNLAVGAPPPSGPWYQVMVTGSRAWRSRCTTPFAPLPPNTMILEPASTAEWPYLAAGGVPEILGLIQRDEFTSKTLVSLRYQKPISCPT